jgi:hypothetical protein
VTLSDTVGATPTLAIFPLIGLERYLVKVQALTGAPTTVRMREFGVSHHAADVLISLGIVHGGLGSDVNLTAVGGTAVVTGGVAGSQGVGGVDADGLAATANPVQVGGVDGAGDVQSLLTDTDGRPQNDIDRWGGTDVLTGGIAGSPGIGGLAAEAATAAGNPLRVAGVDGAGNIQSILTDTDGRPQNDIDRWGGNDVISAGINGTVVAGGDIADGVADTALNGVKLAAVTSDPLAAALATGRRCDVIADLDRHLFTRDKNYDPTTGAGVFSIANPDRNAVDPDLLIDVTNYVTPATYSYYFSPDGFGLAALQFTVDGGTAPGAGVTITFHGTCQDDGTVAASCDYDDITVTLIGQASYIVATGATDDFIIFLVSKLIKCLSFIRVDVAIATTGNTADVTCRLRQRAD